MKRGAFIIGAAAAMLAVAGCGHGLADSVSDGHCVDTTMDHGGWDAVDAVADTSPWPGSDAPPDMTPSDAAADMPRDEATDPVEETEPPPEDVCDTVITEPQRLYLSADDSNSMASPIIARAIIEAGRLVPAWIVRTYEFTNYYDIGYEPAPFGRVNVQVHMKAEDDSHFNLQVGAQSHALTGEERRPINLTFIMDTSGSMTGAPIELERAVCLTIAESLRAGDVVSMVVWNVEDATIIDSHRMYGPGDSLLSSVCSGLTAGGGTNLHGGLVAGYALASGNYNPDYLNRVVLVSDGQANVGITDEDIIAAAAQDEEGEGIYLVGVGVGEGYNDTLMDAVTEAGKGAYVFIDSLSEAEKIFGARFISTLEIAVMDVQVELVLPPWLRIEEFHGEEISTDPKEVEPQHLAPNDAMIFHQLVKACEVPPIDDVIGATAVYSDPVTRERRSDSATLTIGDLLASQSAPQLLKGTAIVEYAEGLKDISDLMQSGNRTGAQETCTSLAFALEDASAATGDADLEEIASLLDRYCSNVTSRTPSSWY